MAPEIALDGFTGRGQTTSGIKFKLVILFVFSGFLLSNDDTLKIASMNASSIVAMLMAGVFLLDGFLRGRFTLQRHPLQKQLFLLFVWAAFTLVISKIAPSKAIPQEAYDYVWTTGLNSPDCRGMAFLFRLFLSVFAIEFIICNVNSKEKYFKVLNYFLLAYASVSFFILTQGILYGLFGMSIGHVHQSDIYFRIGGYIGEPSTLAGILVSGYFILLTTVIRRYKEVWLPTKFLTILLGVTSISLLLTYSVAWIISAVLTVFIIGWKHLSRKMLVSGAVLLILVSVFSVVFSQMVILRALGEVSSLGLRTYSWLSGLYIFIDNLITGAGIGQSVFFMPLYLADIVEGKFWAEFPELFLSFRFPPMNTYIQIMAETGIIGLLMLLGVFFSLFKNRAKIRVSEYRSLVTFGFGGGIMASAIAFNAVPDYFYTGGFNFLLGMYIAGIMVFRDSNNLKENHCTSQG